MKQYGRTINLKNDPQTIERYLEHHRAIWPEVERGLKAIGIQRMLIFKLGRQLFMFMETIDEFEPGRDFARYEAANPRNHEWQELMASMQEPVADAQPTEWWAEMKLVFEL
jgi:L-rhamnose mutarotase